MKKSLLNIGRALNRNEQKQISGGTDAFRKECGDVSGPCCHFVWEPGVGVVEVCE